MHVLPASAWPDAAYDEVIFLGAQRGALAQALRDQTPLLTPGQRNILRELNWSRFDPAEVAHRQDLWLDAWRACTEKLVVTWVTQSSSGRAKVADRWAQHLAEQLESHPLAAQPLSDALPAPLEEPDWSGWERTRWYPSHIESMMSCPRRHLLSKLLGLESHEEERPLQHLSDSLWLGNLMHNIAQAAVETILRGEGSMATFEGLLDHETRQHLERQEPPLSPGLNTLMQSNL